MTTHEVCARQLPYRGVWSCEGALRLSGVLRAVLGCMSVDLAPPHRHQSGSERAGNSLSLIVFQAVKFDTGDGVETSAGVVEV
jgi:hypothetical protein